MRWVRSRSPARGQRLPHCRRHGAPGGAPRSCRCCCSASPVHRQGASSRRRTARAAANAPRQAVCGRQLRSDPRAARSRPNCSATCAVRVHRCATAKDRVGRFREAGGGTLFLDEIGDMPLGDADPAAARAAGAPGDAAGQQHAGAGGFRAGLRHAPGPGARGGAGALPGRPVLPHPGAGAAPAGTARAHRLRRADAAPAGGACPRPGPADPARAAGRAARPPLAGQPAAVRAGAEDRRRACSTARRR
jgi:hypothetical protein